MAKEGSTVGGLMDCFGTAISICLQYGVPLEVLVKKFSHTRFEPMGHTTNREVRIASSLVDYIFRWLGLTFLDEGREARSGLPAGDKAGATGSDAAGHRLAPEKSNGHTAAASNGSNNGQGRAGRKGELETLERPGVVGAQSEQFARFQSDAPACDNCGAITVRNGNCYLCHNCGNSMGCS
jgi:ribonucleoside-diphosphate reductase alpha chain